MSKVKNNDIGRTCLTFGLALMSFNTTVESDENRTFEEVVSSCITAVEARFIESAPTDRFEFTNRSTEGWSIARITVDLEASIGRLIFDTADGDKVIVLDFDTFAPGDSFTFSIDVDDQLVDSSLGQIRVAGSEIHLASLSTIFVDAVGQQQTIITAFDNSARIATDC